MTTAPDETRRRAAPLAPDERRAAILDAVLPLVAERGHDVTTRELAAAAGVAEGTLFRVFPDKNALIGEVAFEGLRRASRPAATRDSLAAVDRTLPLVQRVAALVELGRSWSGEATRWMYVLRALHARAAVPADADHARMAEQRDALLAERELQRAVIVEGVRTVLEPDAHRLRVPLDVAVAMIDAAVAGQHSRDRLLPTLPAAVVADAVVHGLLGAGTTDAAATDPRTTATPSKES
ncbi:regulatory protein TetR [Xylanimonas cellulosilytica DSM 15894]|uniref:Regulatory protein TetR n=1 Tax=Xylanimonas cellulosilytica (strain DSM 15894 / JCM 12276 / CECT 5975 / KCTC 9989 / LMG 20990 / NBRC 107835 / XIL07) TaxID=446471 RepID=D1BRW9_XYLCX|nr:TetR/AcrR family transcriptional regulator [Xylanimonas cellulosilytica]ACZ30461.1 regulatory protein TetR [Xylanimonas cellulosilytica DSM 15894]